MHLHSSQAKKLAEGAGCDLLECPAEPEHSVVEDIIGLLPALQPAIGAEHLPGQTQQPFTGGVEKLFAGRLIARPEAVQTMLEAQRGVCGHESVSWSMRVYSRAETLPAFL